MGRPLFKDSVETDIPSEKAASHARSPIRRNHQIQSNRRPAIRLNSPEYLIPFPFIQPPASEPEPRSQVSEGLPMSSNALSTSRSRRERNTVPTRYEELPPHALPLDRLQRIQRLRGLERERSSRPAQQTGALPLIRLPPGRANVHRLFRERGPEHRFAGRIPTSRLFRETSNFRRDQDVDGLGDRNRSLSPDETRHDAWDTLLTTLTPDPQPPSLGSSFASTIAASHSAAGSVGTSFTEPDRAPEPEPGCDSGGEDRDSSDCEDEALDVAFSSGFRQYSPRAHPLESFRPNQTSRHAVPMDNTLEDMLATVRRLAERSDVPSAFWDEIYRLQRQTS